MDCGIADEERDASNLEIIGAAVQGASKRVAETERGHRGRTKP